jgi:hypothetical protein
MIAAAAIGCGGTPEACPSPGSFPSAPALTLPSASGGLQIVVRTSPQPLARGVNSAQYVVTDSSEKPVTGLEIAVVPWMPDMGHGASVQPSVAEQGDGIYDISCVDIIMPGTWQLRTTFSGPVADNATPTFQVQ